MALVLMVLVQKYFPSKISSKIHTGYVYHYSFSMFIGLALLTLILLYNLQVN